MNITIVVLLVIIFGLGVFIQAIVNSRGKIQVATVKREKELLNQIADLKDRVEYGYISGFNFAWGIANHGDNRLKKPSVKAQYKKWLAKEEKENAI